MIERTSHLHIVLKDIKHFKPVLFQNSIKKIFVCVMCVIYHVCVYVCVCLFVYLLVFLYFCLFRFCFVY